MYYIKAKMSIRVPGISGPFEDNVTWLVHAPTLAIAKQKFESRVKQDNQNYGVEAAFTFTYLEIAGELK
jgi:hypothetical protein